MPTSAYPGGIDNLTDPTSTSAMNNPSHATQHTNANDAIQALEAFTAPFPPAIVTNVLGQTFPDWHATGTLVTLSSGVMYLTGIHLQANLKITNIWFMFGSTTLSTPTHLWSCLLDNTVTTPKLLANSADTLTTVTPTVSVANQFALTTPVTTTYAGFYYLGIVAAASTMSTHAASPVLTANSGRVASLPLISGPGETGLTTVASASAIITPSAYGAGLLAYVN